MRKPEIESLPTVYQKFKALNGSKGHLQTLVQQREALKENIGKGKVHLDPTDLDTLSLIPTLKRVKDRVQKSIERRKGHIADVDQEIQEMPRKFQDQYIEEIAAKFGQLKEARQNVNNGIITRQEVKGYQDQLDQFAYPFFKEAVAQNPDDFDAVLNLGYFSIDREESRACFSKATALNPKEPVAWYNLGNSLTGDIIESSSGSALRRRGAIEQAITVWGRFFTTQKENPSEIVTEEEMKIAEKQINRLRGLMPPTVAAQRDRSIESLKMTLMLDKVKVDKERKIY